MKTNSIAVAALSLVLCTTASQADDLIITIENTYYYNQVKNGIVAVSGGTTTHNNFQAKGDFPELNQSVTLTYSGEVRENMFIDANPVMKTGFNYCRIEELENSIFFNVPDEATTMNVKLISPDDPNNDLPYCKITLDEGEISKSGSHSH